MAEQVMKKRVAAERERERRQRRRKWLLLLLLLLLAAGAAVLLVWQPWNSGPPGIVGGNYNQGALNFTDGELEEYLQRTADENQVTIQINTMPFFYAGGRDGDLLIQNTEHNGCDMSVRIYLGHDDSGQQVYDSGLVPPGAYIDYADLSVSLPKGEHAAIAYISFWDGERHVTTASADMTLVIQS